MVVILIQEKLIPFCPKSKHLYQKYGFPPEWRFGRDLSPKGEGRTAYPVKKETQTPVLYYGPT